MSELFDRRASVTLTPASGTGTGLKIEGLRIAFEIVKSIQSEANTARVELYNLAAATRDRVHEKHDVVRVDAGYAGVVETVFEGEITHAQSARSGADFVTSIECGDGVETFAAQTIERRFQAGTRVREVIKTVASKFTEKIPDVENSPVRFGKAPKKKKESRLSLRSLDADLAILEADLVAQGFSPVVRRAFSVSGDAREVLDKLARMWRFDWSVQDGALQVVSFGRALVGESVLLSPETGLLGNAVKTERGMRAVSLLIPQLRPGVLVTAKSADVTGSFRAEVVKLTGDTHGDTWTAETEATSLAQL